MHSALQSQVEKLSLGEPIEYEQLRVIPIVGPPTGPETRPLSEAIKEGRAEVVEVSQSGEVARLLVLNPSDDLLLGLDGEELIGAKQNRILNATILVPPKSEVVIPVSCIEVGRWGYKSERFSSKSRVIPSSMRGAKAERMAFRLAENDEYDAVQSEIWNDVAAYACEREVRSETGALSDALDRDSEQVEEYVEGVRAEDDWVGFAAYIEGELAGIDVFGQPSSCKAAHERLMRSYGHETVRRSDRLNKAKKVHPADTDPLAFIRSLLSEPPSTHDAPGVGNDLRYRGRGAQVAALMYEEELVHLMALPTPQETIG